MELPSVVMSNLLLTGITKTSHLPQLEMPPTLVSITKLNVPLKLTEFVPLENVSVQQINSTENSVNSTKPPGIMPFYIPMMPPLD